MTTDQGQIIDEEKERCEENIRKSIPPENELINVKVIVTSWGHSTNISGLYCPMIWDGAYCWPYSSAGVLHSMPCPGYIHGFNTNARVTKLCTSNGTWWINEETNKTWTNYTLCTSHQIEFVDNIDDTYHNGIFQPHLPAIKLISKTGYSISLSTLLIAFLILAFIKKLRCPRNNLHMQLFLSFIMRALMFLLKDALFIEGVGFSSNVGFSKEGIPTFRHEEGNIDCKIFMSFWHYFLTANYCWILVEGLYLHNLIFLSMFTDTSSILRYVILGWGLPVFVIIPWVVVRATLEDTLCWTTHDNVKYFWILRGPITLSIVVTFIFFINITRVLFLKMFSSQALQARRYRYRKWFKSTLILVPLFGVHYALLLVVNLVAEVHYTIELIWLYVDQLFSAFQGFFVALLYCFLNGEVQLEVKKLLKSETNHSTRFSHSFITQSLTYLSRGRSSIHSLHSVTDKRDGARSSTPSPCIPKQDEQSSMSLCLTSNILLSSADATNRKNKEHHASKAPELEERAASNKDGIELNKLITYNVCEQPNPSESFL